MRPDLEVTHSVYVDAVMVVYVLGGTYIGRLFLAFRTTVLGF